MHMHKAESLEDAKRIAELAHVIWRDHYIPLIGEEQVSYMLEVLQSAEAIKTAMDDGVCYYLIQDAENDLGYLAYEQRSDHCFLSKLYVLAAQRGRGLGRAGLGMLRREASLAGNQRIRLTVNKDNAASIAWYQAQGFEIIDDIVIDVGSGYVMDDYLMELSL